MSNKVDRDETSFHRVHAVACPLLIFSAGGPPQVHSDFRVPFVLSLPDARARTVLSVFFVADHGISDPNDAGYFGYFAAGNQGLSVLARESAEEQGSGLSPIDQVYGSPSAPVPLAGDLFGFSLASAARAKEWDCLLEAGAPFPGFSMGTPNCSGRWIARATATAAVQMSDEEWSRVVRRLYLRGPTRPLVVFAEAT